MIVSDAYPESGGSANHAGLKPCPAAYCAELRKADFQDFYGAAIYLFMVPAADRHIRLEYDCSATS